MSEESGYRMVLQPMDLRGRMAGPPAVTVNSIARPVVLSVLSSRGLSGMLSVYAPGRDSAAALMREATGTEGVEYGFSVGLMEANLANLRVRKSPSEDDGLPGPICLFGDYLGDGSELDLPGNEARKSDFAWGFHIAGRDVVLSSDLGSSVHSESGFGEVGDGEIRIALDRHPLEGTGHTVSTASGPIGRDVAVAICSDRVRQGVLCVYTPRREDALEIMTEALGGRRPEEVILDGIGIGFFGRKGEKEGPKAFFGRPPE